jgi:hypothetical protein
MNPMHREAVGSADLHLFQELPTLDQQLTRTLLLRPAFGQNKAHVSSAHAAPALRRRGPVLAPPCMRHLPIGIAGA